MPTPAGSQRLLAAVNTTAILRLLEELGPTARPELIRAAGISKTAVGNILDNLVAQGLVIQAGHDADRRGPAAGVWALEPGAAYSAAVDIGHRTISAALADFTGRVLARTESEMGTASEEVPGGLSDAVMRALDEVMKETRRTHPDLRLETVVLGFPTDANVDEQPWKADMVAQVHRHFGAEVKPHPSRILAAHAEMQHEPAALSSSFALLRIGGVAEAALVLDQQVWEGANLLAGDLRALASLTSEPGLPGTASVAADALEAGLPAEMSAKEIFALSARGNEAADRVIEKTAERIAPLVAGIQAVVNPELILLGGGIGSNPELLPRVTRALTNLGVEPLPRMERARSIADPVLEGGLKVASEHTREKLFAIAARSPRPAR